MFIEHYLFEVIFFVVAIIEVIGTFIIALACGRTFYRLAKKKFNFDGQAIKIELAKALALALEFKLAAEILKTVTIRTLEESFVLAAIVVLRVILTAVIHWEIKIDTEEEIKNQLISEDKFD